jgi:hypothetical protein
LKSLESDSEKQVITGRQNRIGNNFRHTRRLDGNSFVEQPAIIGS